MSLSCYCVSEQCVIVFSDRRRHHPWSDTRSRTGTLNQTQCMDYVTSSVLVPQAQVICIPRIHNLVLDWKSNVQSKSHVVWPQQKLLLAVTCFVVDSLVLKASTNTSSCIFMEYMPGSHSPDGQANVKMKSLEQSLTRCLHSTRHVIDYNENFL